MPCFYPPLPPPRKPHTKQMPAPVRRAADASAPLTDLDIKACDEATAEGCATGGISSATSLLAAIALGNVAQAGGYPSAPYTSLGISAASLGRDVSTNLDHALGIVSYHQLNRFILFPGTF